MIPDPTAEIKRIRHELGAQDGFDVGRIFDRLRQLESEYECRIVRQPPRNSSDNNPLHRSGEATRSEVENISTSSGDR